jgi:anti-sigma28 factor (negative regulator of flagellin synthesis)
MEAACGRTNARRPAAALGPDKLPEIRVDKVLEIRRQLGEGTYSIEDRLDVVVDKIIEDLT